MFKTVDGGKTWRRVLYTNPRAGAADLLIDPSHPEKLFAALWEHRRWPWGFKSGGPGSGFYASHDGGETWKRYTEEDGLPKGDLGRIGVAISRSNPNIVYALVEAEKSALLRSSDGGQTWKTVNADQRTAERPFYYAQIHVDPQWPNRLYNLTARLMVSEDSGASFNLLGRSRDVHGDYHAMWIDPHDPDHMVTGSDGGMAISHDRGETWQFVSTLPIGQFYHVDVDMDRPYNVYGGLQDNGSWRGPSSDWAQGGIQNSAWRVIGGGDGFDTHRTPPTRWPAIPNQGGELVRWNLRTRESKLIKPAQVKGREAPLQLERRPGPGPLRSGDDLHRQPVRPQVDRPRRELDGDQPGPDHQQPGVAAAAEERRHHARRQRRRELDHPPRDRPEPVAAGGDLGGVDDGRLHVTRDGGKSWTSVEKNVPGVPANTWIPNILPSKYDAASAFVVFDNHRRQEFALRLPHRRLGEDLKSLATRGLRGYALAVEQDPADRNLLFLGTEFGLYVSFDGGARWTPWKHGLPTTSVMALKIHPRDLDLVIGTHGRALYVLDDITPLRGVSAATLAERVHIYPASPRCSTVPSGDSAASVAAGPASSRARTVPTVPCSPSRSTLRVCRCPTMKRSGSARRANAKRPGPAIRRVIPGQSAGQSVGHRPADRQPAEDVSSRAEAAQDEAAAGGREGQRGPRRRSGSPTPPASWCDVKPAVRLGINRVVCIRPQAYRNPEGQQRFQRPGGDSGRTWSPAPTTSPSSTAVTRPRGR